MKILHFTDIHEDFLKLEKIIKINEKLNADVVFFTGDLGNADINAGDNSYIYRASMNYKESIQEVEKKLKEMGITNIEELNHFNQLSDDQKTNLANVLLEIQEINKKYEKKVIDEYKVTLNKAKAYFKELAKKSRLYGIAGNHDLKIIYNEFKDIMEFPETKDQSVLEDLIIKGYINSSEIPEALSNMNPKYTIDYISYMNEKSTDENISKLIEKLNSIHKNRLNDLKSDILLMHKPVGYDHDEFGCSKLAEELTKNTKYIFAGHFHEGFIKKYKGKIIINPGANHIAYIELNKHKEIEKIELYCIKNKK